MDDNNYELGALDPGVTAEPNWGNANLHGLPPAERRKRAARKNETRRRWAQAEAVHVSWTPEQFEEEETRLRAEIDAWEGQRDAA